MHLSERRPEVHYQFGDPLFIEGLQPALRPATDITQKRDIKTDSALTLALHDFMAEYDGAVCGVCQAEKWNASPFCRLCSIRLQRARLMQRLKQLRAGNGLEGAIRYFHYWDLCRDFLINRRREKQESANGN